MAARKHAEVIKLWADGAPVQYLEATGEWKDTQAPQWSDSLQYRIKPAQPERVYPRTSMSDADLEAVWLGNYPDMGEAMGRTISDCRRACADAVLRHAVDVGLVVTMEQHSREVGDWAARDMAIAEAVRNEIFRALGKPWMVAVDMAAIDLAAIIEKVKP